MRASMPNSCVRIRLTNDRNAITFYYSHDVGKSWFMQGLRMEVSRLHHNVFGGFLGLRIGIYSANESGIVTRDFRHRALGCSCHVIGVPNPG